MTHPPGFWRACLHIFRAAVMRQRAPMVQIAIGLTLLALVLGPLIGIRANPDLVRGLCLGFGIPLAAVSTMTWIVYMIGAVAQHSPVNARLVPGLHRRVRHTTILVYAVALAPLLLCSVVTGPLLLIAVSIAFTALGRMHGGRMASLLVYVAVFIAALVLAKRREWIALLSSAPVLAVLALTSLAYAWDALRIIFPNGGDQHWALLVKQERQRAATNPALQPKMRNQIGANSWWYKRLMLNELGRPKTPLRSLLHGLGPAALPFGIFVFPLLVGLPLGVILKPLFPVLGPPGLIFLLPCLLLPLMADRFLIDSLGATRSEQSLMRLAPVCPAPAQLNRQLGARFLRQSLCGWLGSHLAALCVLMWWGVSPHIVLLAGGMMLASLGLSGAVLRDYAGKDGAPLGSALAMLLVPLVLAILVLGTWLRLPADVVWSPMLVWVALVSAALVFWRWRRMLAAPPAFPANRY